MAQYHNRLYSLKLNAEMWLFPVLTVTQKYTLWLSVDTGKLISTNTHLISSDRTICKCFTYTRPPTVITSIIIILCVCVCARARVWVCFYLQWVSTRGCRGYLRRRVYDSVRARVCVCVYERTGVTGVGGLDFDRPPPSYAHTREDAHVTGCFPCFPFTTDLSPLLSA